MAYETVVEADSRVAPAAAQGTEHPAPHTAGAGDAPTIAGAAVGPTLPQWIVASGLVLLVAAGFAADASFTLKLLHHTVFGLFALVSVARAASAAITAEPRAPVPALEEEALPSYTVLAPLFHEPRMVANLIRSLGALDYPADKLQMLLLLEADDHETIAAAQAACAGGACGIVICPPGHPRTKPRACNIGLCEATGELLVIYDAEDEPDPAQLREAAARFAAHPNEVACLQAPLRIHQISNLMNRQFALEYAALFEIVLPALARVGAPFPLGGTSNHFRTQALRRAGGWDAYNVTEDADLGFRLSEQGYRLGVLSAPTRETAPDHLGEWLRQRARWIKGYMQTWGVHTRAVHRAPLRNTAVLTLTVGLAIASAFVHGPAVAWIIAELLLWAYGGGAPEVMVLDVWLLVVGWMASIGTMALGAHRAQAPMSFADALIAPFYWALQTPAAIYAAWQLASRPFHWDKTPHRPRHRYALRP